MHLVLACVFSGSSQARETDYFPIFSTASLLHMLIREVGEGQKFPKTMPMFEQIPSVIWSVYL